MRYMYGLSPLLFFAWAFISFSILSLSGMGKDEDIGTQEPAKIDDGRSGDRLLIRAIMERWTEIASSLLEGGINPNAQIMPSDAPYAGAEEIWGYSALMVAATKGYPDLVKMLLEHGADPEITNKNGERAQDCTSSEMQELIQSYKRQ